jgi:hypothetical protein
MFPDRGFNRGFKSFFGYYWDRFSVTTGIKEYMAQSRFEQILHAARCIGARGRTTMTAYPMRIFGYSFGNPHCKIDFPYAEASMEKAFEWWRIEGPPPEREKHLQNKADWRRTFFRYVSLDLMKDGRDKMPNEKMVVHDETAYEE